MTDNGCCGNEAWRGRLCPYHQGYEDGRAVAETRWRDFPSDEAIEAARFAMSHLAGYGTADRAVGKVVARAALVAAKEATT
jgi:hypothetical protein